MRAVVVATTLASVLALGACSAGPAATAPAPAAPAPAATAASGTLLERLGYAGKDVRQLVAELERTGKNGPEGLKVAITQAAVTFTQGSERASVPLPADATYVSLAPYVTRTHECFNHVPTSCQGELARRPVTVRVTDGAGRVVTEQRGETFANGFVGVWLPRGLHGTVTVDAEGRSVTAPLATGADDPTCVTTLRLA